MSDDTGGPVADITLEIFGQQSSAGIQTPFLFCYSSPDTPDIDGIVQRLENGLLALCAALPWVAGNVICEDDDQGGVFKIRTTRAKPVIVVKDHREDLSVPSMSRLQAAGFPTSQLDEDLLSPVVVIPQGERIEDRTAVVTLQVNLLRGGIILNLSGHHQVLDGTGQEQIAYFLNKACRGEPFTEEEVRIGNLDRASVVKPLPDAWQPGPNSPYLKDSSDDTPPPRPPGELVWTDLPFASDSLARLKQAARTASGYVSTDDALTAHLWQALARARRKRHPGSTPSTLGRAVNPRRYLDIPATYPGYISNMAHSRVSLDELADSPLSTVAKLLRSAVDPATSRLGESTLEYATLLYRARDKDSVSANQHLDLDTDLMVSSWAGMRCYRFDFGLGLGPPRAFRRTKHVPVPSLMFILPKDPGGGVVVTICARADDVEGLKEGVGAPRTADGLQL